MINPHVVEAITIYFSYFCGVYFVVYFLDVIGLLENTVNKLSDSAFENFKIYSKFRKKMMISSDKSNNLLLTNYEDDIDYFSDEISEQGDDLKSKIQNKLEINRNNVLNEVVEETEQEKKVIINFLK